jgi:hypothetical protein
MKNKITFLFLFALLGQAFAGEVLNCNRQARLDSHQKFAEDVSSVLEKLPRPDWKVPKSCVVPTLSADSKSFIDPNNRCTFYSCADKSVVEAGICKKDDPNAYFINYGEKYCKRFSEKTNQKISEKGNVWLNKTLVCLQQAVVGFCDKNSCSNCEKIRELAYTSHADCYTKSGLCYLNPYDLFLIGVTPDIKNDVLNKDGLKQVAEVAGLCGGSYAINVADYTEKKMESFAEGATNWAKRFKRFVKAETDRILE